MRLPARRHEPQAVLVTTRKSQWAHEGALVERIGHGDFYERAKMLALTGKSLRVLGVWAGAGQVDWQLAQDTDAVFCVWVGRAGIARKRSGQGLVDTSLLNHGRSTFTK